MKGKSAEKKKPATPVVLIDESEDLASTIMISKMLNGKENSSNLKPPAASMLGGGYKYRPEEGASKVQSKVESHFSAGLMASVKTDKQTVYDDFGIVKENAPKKKYREPPAQLANAEVELKPAKVNPWVRAEQSVMNQEERDYYDIFKGKGRQQSAIHVKSSLQVINLDNIEAKLQAHRQTMKPIEEQYNLVKGKSTVMPQQAKPQLRFNVDADKQLQGTKPKQVYELIKEKQQRAGRPEQELTMEELWEEKKRSDPKLAEYEFKYQQYMVEKGAKKVIGSVVKNSTHNWDKYAKQSDLERRKQARKHKSKEKQYGERVEQAYLGSKASKVYAKVKEGIVEEEGQQEGGRAVDLREKIASKDDKFIGKFIMKDIDIDKTGAVSKQQLAQYLSSKPHLVNGYHIDLAWLYTDLDNFATKRKGMLSQAEVIQFLATLSSIRHPAMALTNVSAVKGQENKEQVVQRGDKNKLYSSYFKQHESVFEKIFEMLDIGEDRIIKRQEFIENIFIDTQCSKFVDKDAIRFNLIDKRITFRQILAFILDDYLKESNPKLKKAKEYITFERFKEYFEVPESLDLAKINAKSVQRVQKKANSHQIDMYDIEDEYLVLLKDIFDTVPRVYQDYITTRDFLAIASKDPQVLALSQELCRIQSTETKLPVETIKSTLARMKKECEEYATWQMLKVFFSRRGRPLDWDYDMLQSKKNIRQQQVKNASVVVKQSMPADELQPAMARTAQAQTSSSPQKYTVPQPFNITDERELAQAKANKSKELVSSEQKEIEELQKKFKAQPVNKDILGPKPELIQGKAGKSSEKSVAYNYENYENDRIQRVLKKAQEKHEEEEQIRAIKQMTEVKANTIKANLTKTVKEVMTEQQKAKSALKSKVTKAVDLGHLYPDNPAEQGKRKLEKLKVNMGKQEEASKMRETLKKEAKDKTKERNEKARQAAQQQKKKELQQKRQRDKLEQGSFKPSINKHELSQTNKQALTQQKEERERKKQEAMAKHMEVENAKKKKILSHVKKEHKLDIAGLDKSEILERFEEVDFEDLCIDEGDCMSFRKEYGFKNKPAKEIKDTYRGLAGRERAAMEAQQRRLELEKRSNKEKKQSKIVEAKKEAAKGVKDEVGGTMNMDPNFHRSRALRRYRAIMENKEPLSEYDQYSTMGREEQQEP